MLHRLTMASWTSQKSRALLLPFSRYQRLQHTHRQLSASSQVALSSGCRSRLSCHEDEMGSCGCGLGPFWSSCHSSPQQGPLLSGSSLPDACCAALLCQGRCGVSCHLRCRALILGSRTHMLQVQAFML